MKKIGQITVGEELLRLKASCEVLSADIEALVELRKAGAPPPGTAETEARAFDEIFRVLRRAILTARLPEIEKQNPVLAAYLREKYDLPAAAGGPERT